MLSCDYIRRLEAALRMLMDNYFLRSSTQKDLADAGLREDITTLLKKGSILADLSSNPEAFSIDLVSVYWRLTARTVEGLQADSLSNCQPRDAGSCNDLENRHPLRSLVHLAEEFGLTMEVQAVRRQTRDSVLYVSGADGVNSQCAIVHVEAIQSCIEKCGLALRPFLQCGTWQSEQEAAGHFRDFLIRLNRKPLAAIAHSSGAELLWRCNDLVCCPIILLAPSLTTSAEKHFIGQQIILPEHERYFYRWDPSCAVHVISDATHAMSSPIVLERLVESIEAVIGRQ